MVKDWKFCNQILKDVAILDKKLRIFIFFFSALVLLFSKISSILRFQSAVAFQRYNTKFINFLKIFKKF